MSVACGTTDPAGAWCEYGRQGRTRSLRIHPDPESRTMPSTPLAAHLPPSPAVGAAPVMRLITVPDAAPPYDCDAHGADCQAAHATRKRTRGPSQSRSAAAQDRSPGGRTRSARKATNVQPASPREASPASAAMTAGWPGQFAQVIVEILGGSRSPRQLIPLTTEGARSQISLLTSYVAAGQRPKVKRVMVSRPTERVMEMTMIVCFGVRSRALAMRLEHCAGRPAAPGLPARPARWICTEAETG
jgi:hypothetical protein